MAWNCNRGVTRKMSKFAGNTAILLIVEIRPIKQHLFIIWPAKVRLTGFALHWLDLAQIPITFVYLI